MDLKNTKASRNSEEVLERAFKILYRSGPAYKKAKNISCVFPDEFLSFKLLDAANLSQIERNLVLTGVDYTGANLLGQMQTALQKFIGRSALKQ